MCQWHQWIIQIFPTKLKEKTHFTTFHFRTVLGCKLHVPLQLAGASVAHRCCVGAISVELSSQNGTKLRTPNNSCKILACIFRDAPEQAHDLAASLKCIHLRVNCEISHKMHVTLSLRKQTPFCCFDCQRLPSSKRAPYVFNQPSSVDINLSIYGDSIGEPCSLLIVELILSYAAFSV